MDSRICTNDEVTTAGIGESLTSRSLCGKKV